VDALGEAGDDLGSEDRPAEKDPEPLEEVRGRRRTVGEARPTLVALDVGSGVEEPLPERAGGGVEADLVRPAVPAAGIAKLEANQA